MAGTSAGGKKAAATRGYQSLSEAGRKGGKNSHRNRHKTQESEEQRNKED